MTGRTGKALTVLAGVAVLAALVLPRGEGPFPPAAFVRIPVESLLGVVVLLVVPARSRPVVAGALGAALGLLTALGLLDLGFRAVLARPFDPVDDATLLGAALGFLAGSYGVAAAVGIGVLAASVPVLVALAVLRLSGVVVRRRVAATRAVAVLLPVWVASALLGTQIVPGVPVASADAAGLALDTAVGVPASLRDQREFAVQLTVDPFSDRSNLLAALRGKDVVVAFVESYGRDAVADPEFAPQVGAVLDDGTRRLEAAGFASRSAFLTSPIAGGGSWLAHATFGSGLRVDDEARYRTLVGSDRLTLSRTFADSGWRTVAVMPGTTSAWPEAGFYGYDQVLDFPALGYRGPDLGWASVPDQYTLSAFQRLTTGGDAPVMAEIALVSSHAPWPLVPPLLAWDDIGDGSVFGSVPARSDRDAIWDDGTAAVRAEYRRSIEYSLGSLVSWVETFGDDDLVLVLLGDHQPLPAVTGEGAGRDVPISIVTRDRAVLDRTVPWGWDAGLRPGVGAPVWPMEDFRDRFLSAFGP